MRKTGHWTPSKHIYLLQDVSNKLDAFFHSIPVGGSVEGEYGREVDVAKKDVEGEEGKSDQILVGENHRLV